MFAAPTVRDFKDPADEIDTMQRYILTLKSVTDEGVSSFAKDRAAPNAEHSIKWIWNIHKTTGEPLLNTDDTLFEMWEWTGNRTGRKKDGSPSKARERLEALVGRELADDEITRVPIDKLTGRRVFALFHRVKTPATDGSGDIERVKVLKVAPYKEQGATAPVVAPAPTQAAPADDLLASAPPTSDGALPF